MAIAKKTFSELSAGTVTNDSLFAQETASATEKVTGKKISDFVIANIPAPTPELPTVAAADIGNILAVVSDGEDGAKWAVCTISAVADTTTGTVTITIAEAT